MEIIHYRNVEIHRKELVVFRGINLTVTSGEMVYLTGKVGCGKSSLLKSMYAEVPIFSSTQAQVLGYNLPEIRKRDVPYLRRKIGVVFQDFQLLKDRNVQANLEFVLRATGWKRVDEIEARIREALDRVGMEKKSYKMPHELSGGEQQRIVIARALLNSPQLILADEPTGNLDGETGDAIVSQLQEIAASGTAVVMATHNLSWPDKYPGRVLVCRNKKVEETALEP